MRNPRQHFSQLNAPQRVVRVDPDPLLSLIKETHLWDCEWNTEIQQEEGLEQTQVNSQALMDTRRLQSQAVELRCGKLIPAA